MFLNALLLLSLPITLCGSATQAEIYKYVASDGTVKFTDRPPHKAYVKLVKTWKGWTEPLSSRGLGHNRQKYTNLVTAAASRYRISSNLVNAVIHAESFYNPSAISSAGAVGLMQLMPETARRYGVGNRESPAQNIDGGVRYLRDLMKMFDNDLALAVAAYNAGENTVKRYGYRIPPYQETQNYVKRVISLYKKYRRDTL